MFRTIYVFPKRNNYTYRQMFKPNDKYNMEDILDAVEILYGKNTKVTVTFTEDEQKNMEEIKNVK